jgi:putative thioredoxin
MAVAVTDATFQSEVIDRSLEVAVVVDLWAPWCGPCRTLGPILEKVVDATAGEVALATVNVDENPRISQTFQVQSIPAVYALRDGKVVAEFIGAQGEPFVTEWVDRLRPTEADRQLRSLLDAGDESSLRRALELAPDHHDAIVRLAELLVEKGESDDALALLERIPETPDTRRVAALARTGGQVADDGLADKLDALLERVKDDDGARQEFVDLLEVLGPDDPRTAEYRRALTSRLY